MKFIQLPTLPANGPGGSYVIDCPGIEGSYPPGVETHAYVRPEMVMAINPVGLDFDGNPMQGAYLTIYGSPSAIRVYLPAEKVAEIVEDALKDSRQDR